MVLPLPIKFAPDWTKDLRIPYKFSQHKHDLPLCRPAHHHPSCASHGPEGACVRIVKGFDFNKNKFVFGALCTHMDQWPGSGT